MSRVVSEPNDFLDLLALCRNGDETALKELVRRYKHHVRTAVRSKLPDQMRTRFDSADFTQEVWASFFRATLDRVDLHDETSLINYLYQMARWKVGEEYRHQQTRKGGLGRHLPIEDAGEPRALVATPSAEVIADDEWQLLTAGLSERDLKMLTMLREGQTHAVIAEEFGLSQKTVQRLVARLQLPPSVNS